MKSEILKMHHKRFSYGEIADKLNITRSSVAGVIWRYNNPGMWTKKIRNNTSSRKRYLLRSNG